MKNKINQDHNLNDLLDLSCRYFADRPALSMALESPMTYKDLHKRVIELAAMLRETGIKTNDRIALLGENSPNWVISYFAIIRTGAIAVPVLTDFPDADVRHILTDTNAKILFISSRQMEKIFELEDCKITKIIILDDYRADRELDSTVTFTEFIKESAKLSNKKFSKLTELAAKINKEFPASIIYTSGTSGHSKGVLLSHHNFYANVKAADQLIELNPEWTFLSLLPISHAYEFTVGLLLPILNGCRIVYAGKPPTPLIMEKICRQEKPEAICTVPMIIEKIYKKKILKTIEKNYIIGLAVNIPALRRTFYKKIKKKLLAFFGGNLKILAIGGAPLNRDTEKFLKEADLPYLTGYGLTESSPLLAAGPFKAPDIKIGSCGRPLPEMEIKIKNPDPLTGIGEIIARGPSIMQGYYNNPELTAETIDPSGWLNTGDLGKFDSQGNLHIKGRRKNMIVLANGENIYPEAIESKINAKIYIAESLVKKNNGKLEARVYLDYSLIDQETPGQSRKQRKEYIDRILAELKDSINQKLPPYSRIYKIIERQEPFIKTATKKIKRYLYT
ncbi:MAG: AMP-binding protein [Desulfobia sp.]